jgi:hypothetical protein
LFCFNVSGSPGKSRCSLKFMLRTGVKDGQAIKKKALSNTKMVSEKIVSCVLQKP